ncbi:MAG: ATP-dependent zinc metalloprotease FtsH [Flavobacteriia bacterium]
MKLDRNQKNESGNTVKKDTTKKPFNFFWLIFLGMNVIIISYFILGGTSNPMSISWKEFSEDLLKNGDVQKVIVVDKSKVEVYLTPSALKKDKYRGVAKGPFGYVKNGPNYEFSIGSVDLFEARMEKLQEKQSAKIDIIYVQGQNWWGQVFSWILPLILLFFLSRFLFSRLYGGGSNTGRSIFDFGKSSPQFIDKGQSSSVTFKDVAGYEEAKIEIMEVVDFLKNPGHFSRLGAKIPRGILLIGAPGTGKTLMAKAVAGEAGVPFFSLSGSAFIEMFVGVGASRVRDLFERAKMKAPSIVFIDEIDTIGRMRGRAMSLQSNDERDSTLNQLLAEMDGFGPATGVIVLAATNRADILDPALLRPGRFDRHIVLDLPNKQERLEIFKVHLQPLQIDNTIDSELLAAETPGFSGADIANICNEAALIAARKKKTKISEHDFDDAIDRVVSGIEKKGKILSEDEKKMIAYHEAGHTIVGWMLENMDPIQKVTIIPRGRSLGGAWFLPEERSLYTRSQFNDQLSSALAGRCAEEIVFGDISSGAADDLERATRQAYMMVSELGFSSRLENVSFIDSSGSYDSSFLRPFSESTSKLIDEEVRMLLMKAKARATRLLNNNRSKLDELAAILVRKEEVFHQELEKILGKREPHKAIQQKKLQE